jgi:hypothetical protein
VGVAAGQLYNRQADRFAGRVFNPNLINGIRNRNAPRHEPPNHPHPQRDIAFA